MTNQNRGKILWIDDEIDHLKPHILALEEKGYGVKTATNGSDGIALAENEPFHLALIDQFMSGMDGLETLRRLKESCPVLPVVMITKSEEEWLMDEAISEQVDQFLIKPVNPSQVFMACKQVLEKHKIRGEKATSGYLQEFQDIESKISGPMEFEDWWKIHGKLVKWQLEFDEHSDTGLGNILSDQIQSANRAFVQYIEENYTRFISSDARPQMVHDTVPNAVVPRLKDGKKVCLLILDCMRYDHFRTLLPDLRNLFDVSIDASMALIPSATPYSRNAIFSGMLPNAFCEKYPEQIEALQQEKGVNRFEETYLKDQLKANGMDSVNLHYQKIWKVSEGNKYQSRVGDYLETDLMALVVNFIDILAHARSESDVLQEMVPDESGYRSSVKTWFKNSWLLKVLKTLKEAGFTIILTSDHGSIRVGKGVLVGADKETSSGIRYKMGRNLNCSEKNALIIRNPKEYGLPDLVHQTNYLIAKDDAYFLYPNQQHRYEQKIKDSFQHGGISMDELLVPLAVLTPLN